MRRFVWPLALVAFAAPVPATAQPMPSVVELFTSQGCSSCPAADRLLAELAAEPAVVALSFAVDYWDYLGWKDTLARPAHSARQKAYAEMRGDRKVYTPQVVVNGRAGARGHDRAGIERAMAATRVERPVAVAVRRVGDDVEIALPRAAPGDRVGEVWALAVSRRVAVDIVRGENAGSTISYHNVVRGMVKVADWLGDAQRLTRPVRDLVGDDGDLVVVLVQAGHAERPGPVLGVATLPLN